MTCNPGTPVDHEPELALVDYYMPVGSTGFRFVAALQAQLRAWGPVFSTVATQAAYRRAGSTLAHMALVSGQTFQFLRLSIAYTQAQVAVLLGVTVPEVQAWESDATPVPTNLWYELAAEVCRVDLRQFTPYVTLPPVDLRPRVVRVFPDIPQQSTASNVSPCPCPC
jgi:hypothetical protein